MRLIKSGVKIMLIENLNFKYIIDKLIEKKVM